MQNAQRRAKIQETLKSASTPITATTFAKQYGVSRQTIVGDIALLRAKGETIIPTPRGYRYAQTGQNTISVVCRHFPDDAETEMTVVVNAGGVIEDVEVEHPLYGLLRGDLHVGTLKDVAAFKEKRTRVGGHLLSELTDGIHTHTISAANQDQLVHIKTELKKAGFLYE